VIARRTAALALVAALGAAQNAAAAGEADGDFGRPLGLGARAAAVALASDGRIVVAGDRRGAGGEGALTARFTPAGLPDLTFAGSGSRVDRFGRGAAPQRGGAVAVQADGKTLVAGVAGDRWSLARFSPDGSLDGLFGAAGVTLRDPVPGAGPPEEYPDEEPRLPDGTGPAAIALTAAGQIVVAGNAGVANDDGEPGEQIVVARLGDRGVPDLAFGRDGFAVLQLGFGSAVRHASSAARALSLLPDGRILIAGRASARDGGDRVFVARLSADGRLDASFAKGGRSIAQLGRASLARVASSSLEALAQRPDGRLLAAGRATGVGGSDEVLLAAFSADGRLDAGFGRAGSVRSQLAVGRSTALAAAPSLARALALAPDGSATVAGAAGNAAGRGGALAARFGPRGALDCGYGVRGRSVTFGAGGFDAATDGAFDALLQPDGRLLLAGRLPGGGPLLGRLRGGAAAAQRAAAPRLVTLRARYAGGGRGYAYGLVDGGCATTRVRFELPRPDGRRVLTKVQQISARFGPQVVCAPLSNLRPGASHRVRIATAPGAARRASGVWRVVRAQRASRRAPAQEGCR